ncbi:hypothetical protein GQ54DRAFT_324978 [Martensiomyces pterosporus]|nr:hypothetical protein GQ54DRAFT_324978 [Martensiomyces pterosporus]
MDFLTRSRGTRMRPPTREQVVSVYRGILKQARRFFDENTREFIQTFAQTKFRSNQRDRKPERAHKKLKNARTALHLLERANAHRFKDAVSVLEFGYGRKGPRRMDMLRATAGIGKREGIFGNLREVARYRPAFYAIAKNQYGEKKLEVNLDVLKSKNHLNIAKMQDMHWSDIRRRLLPPVDQRTMELLEERARTGVVDTTRGMGDRDSEAVRRWERQWVKMPHKRQAVRFYRELLGQVTQVDVSVGMVPNTALYRKSAARRSTKNAAGMDKPSAVPKKVYAFSKSLLAGKKPPSLANAIDLAGL